jgi:hypothetical protein
MGEELEIFLAMIKKSGKHSKHIVKRCGSGKVYSKRLEHYPMTDKEQRLWFLDQRD